MTFFGRVADPLPSPAVDQGKAQPAAGSKGKGISLKDPKVLGVLGAGAVVVLALVTRGGGEPAGAVGGEIDTRDTDLYGDLQPELEHIGDELEDLNQRGGRRKPRPRKPRPGQHDGQHHPHAPGPRPDPHKPHPHHTPPTKPEPEKPRGGGRLIGRHNTGIKPPRVPLRAKAIQPGSVAYGG